MNKISQINKILFDYFELNSSISMMPAKDMMPYFILAGIFKNDVKNGFPIRKLLRGLDENNELHQIPYVYAERKTANTNWFFRRTESYPSESKETVGKQKLSYLVKSNHQNDRDEHYVLDLCDAVLDIKGSRQHRFDFLLGDPNIQGRCVRLPVDIYYSQFNLVIEYKEQQHVMPNKHFDKPNLFTVSGVHRGDQRKIYDQRRLDVLPKFGLRVIEIFYSDFNVDSRNRILRNTTDFDVIKKILKR